MMDEGSLATNIFLKEELYSSLACTISGRLLGCLRKYLKKLV